ncbi:trimethylamine methyltransferase family protein [Kumtagia ephedrae]|jgi:trimethylamine--corrinoid protein Co-methyltransferase|uniref:Methyltransferase n=1 Tax=Kumtagia ephedrae TaxID=2116701 RepID=A0A2P7RXN7_9HYPH|nr:trimethylamine methyltransferase family protein [Mesorhizobium ephedrae]PSJ54990.1 trimethylamine methyltransferase [Mesorhizobium ephedrae]
MSDNVAVEQEAGGGRRGRADRGGGAAARRAARSGGGPGTQLTYIKRQIPLYEVLGEEGLALIEANADTVLQEIGIEFRDDAEALALWKEAGADIKGERVRFPKGLPRSLLKTAPPVYTQHARNPARSVEIGGKGTVFAPVYGPPFVRDLDGNRRYATIEDFRNFVKLAYMAPSIHHSGGTVCEPVDVPVNKRHLDMVYSHIKYSDKPFMGSVTAPERAEDTVAMAKIVFGDDFVENNTVLTSLINANSPMVFDETMLGALKVYARHNQACIVTPFILAGAMSPVTVAGTLTQVLAEVLAGAAFTQLIRPGAPVLFGTFASSISMQSGAPTFGTPEPSLVSYGAAQLARRLGLPFRTGGSLCASKIPDAQAAYESANTLNSTILAGTNFVLHSAGWLEGGLASCYEKFMMDVDQLGMSQKFAEGVDLSENGQAMEAIRQVGPGSHYLGCDHTQANFQTAFYRSSIADNNSYEQWQAEGEKSASQRANELARRWLESYEAPYLDPAIDEALTDFIAGKKNSMPDAFT